MKEELEELKSKWIIDEKRFDERKIRQYIKRLLNYCKITKKGEVDLTEKSEKFSLIDKVKLALTARFVASKLDNSISETVSAKEISKFFLVDKLQVVARLKEAIDEKFAFRDKKGVYKLNPSRLDAFLDNLEKKYGEKNE